MGCGHSIYSDSTSADDISSGVFYDRNVDWALKLPWGRAQEDDEDEGMTEERMRRQQERERMAHLRERALERARREAARRRADEAREARDGPTRPPCIVCKDDFDKWYQEYLQSGQLPKEFQDYVCGDDCVAKLHENEKTRCPGAKKPVVPCTGGCHLR